MIVIPIHRYKALLFSIMLSTFSLYLIGQPISEYDGKYLQPSTLKIIDSLSSFKYKNRFTVHEWYPVNLKSQNEYWNSHNTVIPAKDFFILANHISPTIRYYAYDYIIQNQLTSSKLEFLLDHLEDVEKVLFVYGKNSLFPKPSAQKFRPLLLSILYRSNLSENEQVMITKVIIDLKIKDNDLMDYALEHLELNESNYPTIKLVANDNTNNKAIALLAEYQKKEDQDFLKDKLKSIYRARSYSLNERFLKFAFENNFPNDPAELFLALHQEAKESNQLSVFLRKNSDIYTLIVVNSEAYRETILLDLLTARDVGIDNRKEHLNRINSIIRDLPAKELLDFRVMFWKQSGRLKCASLEFIKNRDLDLALQIAKKDLALLEKDEFLKLGCIRTYVRLLEENNLSAEKYINWGLQASDRNVRLNAINSSCAFPYPTAKKHLFNLWGPENNEYEYPSIIRALAKQELNLAEKDQIKEWYYDIRFKKKYKEHFFRVKEMILEMGIEI